MASSKNTALHLTLVFFVVVTMISGVAAIVLYNQNGEYLAREAELKSNATTADQERRNTLDQLAALKKLAGYDSQEEFGDTNPSGQDADPQTVLGKGQLDIQTYAGTPQPATLSAALQKLYAELVELQANHSQLDLENQNLQAVYDALDATNKQLLAATETKRQDAEAGRITAEDTTRLQLAKVEGGLTAEIAKNGELQAALDALETEYADYKRMHIDRMKSQKILMARLNKELDKIRQPSFDHADGKIVSVDRRGGRVTINLGSAQKLPKRLSFSVYKKSHHGVGRESEGGKPADIIGAIEVTRIADTNLAEAKIVQEDVFELIRPGDPIYSPLWAPGISESFALVGVFDLDNDGRSDNKKLHELADVAGAKIVAETDKTGAIIDENGEVLDASKSIINHSVKFLVIGDLPDPTEGADDEETAMRLKLVESYQTMQSQAIDHGVRLVRMNDFLAFIGYKPERRIYRPGDNRPYTLRYGSRSITGRSQAGLPVRHSHGGNVTGLFTGKAPRSSQGNTAKIFRGGANKY